MRNLWTLAGGAPTTSIPVCDEPELYLHQPLHVKHGIGMLLGITLNVMEQYTTDWASFLLNKQK